MLSVEILLNKHNVIFYTNLIEWVYNGWYVITEIIMLTVFGIISFTTTKEKKWAWMSVYDWNKLPDIIGLYIVTNLPSIFKRLPKVI